MHSYSNFNLQLLMGGLGVAYFIPVIMICPIVYVAPIMEENVIKEFVAARQVYIYRAYKDMEIFHFTIPPHVSTAFFNLSSNSTGSCEPRNVTVFLQAETFPVVSPDGAIFPDSTWINRQTLYQATLLSNLNPVYLTVEAPKPGDWFMIGFIFDESNRITQAGLFPSCYAWLQIDATYLQKNDIEILNTHIIVNEISFSPYTINSSTYFSFFVPSQVGRVNVMIRNGSRKGDVQLATFLNEDNRNGSRKGEVQLATFLNEDNSTNSSTALLLLRPSALPFRNGPNVIERNCSFSEVGICDLTFAPKEDSWHYLALTPEESPFEFEIGISIELCSVEESVLSEDFVQRSDLEDFASRETDLIDKLKALHLALNLTFNDSTPENDQNILTETNYLDYHSVITDHQTEIDDKLPQDVIKQHNRLKRAIGLDFLAENVTENSSLTFDGFSEKTNLLCWPRHHLMRKTFPGNFVYEYDLQPVGNASAPLMLNLSNASPTLLSFDLQPIIDIGGTLVVDLAISPFMNVTSHNFTVIGCLNFGIRSNFEKNEGSLTCSHGQPLLVNTSSMAYFSSSVMVPYPEPGRWFLTLYPFCYLVNGSDLVHCTNNITTVIFSIASASCVLGKCGNYGVCYQMISGGFIFSTCSCEVGYRGYACSDASEAIPDWTLLLSTLLLCLSNLFFLPAIFLAAYRRYLTEALVYTFTMCFSTFYHACGQDIYSFCLLRLSVLQFCDFYSAILSFWVTLIIMANLPSQLYSILHMAGAVIIALGVEYDRTGLLVFAIPSLSGFVIMVIAWLWHSRHSGTCYPSRDYWIRCLLPGTVLASTGLICFAFLETEDNYYIIHSVWHSIMALSILCLLPPKRGKHSELQNSVEITQASDSQTLTNHVSI